MDYQEKLRLAKEALDSGSYDKETIEYIFPELKEDGDERISEDERIRKALITYIKYNVSVILGWGKDELIAWLEKQSEIINEYEDKLDRCACESFDKGYKAALENQGKQKEINLVEILKHYPRETELYSPLYGELWLAKVDEEHEIITCYKHPLDEECTRAILEQEATVSFYSNGTTGLPDYTISKDCMLFLYNIEKQGEQKQHLELKAGHWYFCHQAYCERADILTVKEGETFKCEKDGIVKGFIIKEPEKYFREISTPSDKVKPKFKVGDWITNGATKPAQISSIKDGLYFTHNDTIGGDIESMDKEYHLWTIQDAKKGDILEFADHGRIVIGIVSYVNKVTGKVDVNCLLEGTNFKLGNYYALDTIKPHPATKEQRDLLFQKMKEAGYEWDDEKKELRKIEEKPVEWNSCHYDDICEILINLIHSPKSNVNKDVVQKDLDWFVSIAEKMQSYTKTEWSEEDEKKSQLFLAICDDVKGDSSTYSTMYREIGELKIWLKSLKERYT